MVIYYDRYRLVSVTQYLSQGLSVSASSICWKDQLCKSLSTQGCALRHSCSRSRSSGNSSNRNAQFNKSHFSPSHRRGDSPSLLQAALDVGSPITNIVLYILLPPFSPSSGARCWLRRREGNRLWDTSHRRSEWRGTFFRFRHAQLPDRLYRHGHFTGGHPQYDRLVRFVDRLFKWLIVLFVVYSRETPERNTSPLSFLPSFLTLPFILPPSFSKVHRQHPSRVAP